MRTWQEPWFKISNPAISQWMVLQNVIIPTLLAIASAVGTTVISSSIEGSLAIEGSRIQWITINYLLGTITVVPIANYFADKYGYKLLYFIGISLFLLGTLGSAFSMNFWQLSISRTIEGIGGGIIFPVGLATIAHHFPKEKLSLAVNLYLGISFGGGFAGGAALGGFIGMYYPWSWFFLLMVPNCLLAMTIILIFQTETEKIERGIFDLLGFILFVFFISFLLIALANGQLKSTAEGWSSSFILGSLLISFISLLGFIWQESRVENPMVPLPLFKNIIFSLSCITLFTVGMSIFSSPSYMARYMLEGLHYDKSIAGLMLVSYGAALGIFSIASNVLIKKIPPTIVSIIGLSIIIISYFLNNLLTIQSGKVILTTILILRGIGAALSMGPIMILALQNVPQNMTSQASTLLTFFRQCGGTFGGTVLGIFFLRREIFHTARFSEPVNPQLPGYQNTLYNLQNQITQRAGSFPKLAQEQAKKIIEQNIETQSLIQSINDAMIIFGYITICITLTLVLSNFWNWYKEKFLI